MNVGASLQSGEINGEGVYGPLGVFYNSIVDTQTNDNPNCTGGASLALNVRVRWNRNPITNQIVFGVEGFRSCNNVGVLSNNNTDTKVKVLWEIDFGPTGIVFESEPDDALPNLWYES